MIDPVVLHSDAVAHRGGAAPPPAVRPSPQPPVAATTPVPGRAAHIALRPASVAGVLAGVVVLLLAAYLFPWFSRTMLGRDHLLGLLPAIETLFDLNGEGNVPAWFSSSLLLLSGLLLGVVALAERAARSAFRTHWWVLGLVFVYLSLDEAVGLHERTIAPLRAVVGSEGVLFHSWVVAGAAVVLLVAVAYLRFLRALPGRTRRLVLLSGALYVGGALGMEMLGGYYVSLNGGNVWPDPVAARVYLTMTTAEEMLEMLGLVAFVYALLDHLVVHHRGVRFGGTGGHIGQAAPESSG